MANIVTITNIPGNFLELQDYSIQDDNLITNSTVQSTFDPLQNYISYFAYNVNNELILCISQSVCLQFDIQFKYYMYV